MGNENNMMESIINHEQRGHKPKAIIWFAATSIVLLCVATIIISIVRSMPPYSASYHYNVYYRDNIVCNGRATADGLSLCFDVLSVVAWKEDRVLEAISPISLVVDRREYNIAEITPTILKAIVGDGETLEEYIDDRKTLWVTIDNSESDSPISYGITFVFDNNKVRTINLLRYARRGVESRFGIAIDGQLLPALPTDLKEMEKILGEPISIEKSRIY